MTRVRNAIVALGEEYVTIYKDTIMDCYQQSVALEMHSKDMLTDKGRRRITEQAKNRVKKF